MKRIAITGGKGFLGSRIVEYYSKNPDLDVKGISHEDLDFTDPNYIYQYFKENRPDILIHAGAISDTGICQKNPELSYKVNVLGTRWIADICREFKTKLIFCSSDQIYNGNTQMEALKEDVSVSPVNIYGKHKLEAEHWCLKLSPDSICLRLSWMFDLPDGTKKVNSNLLVTVMEALKWKKNLQGAVHEYRGMTYVKEAVMNLEKVFCLPGGIYNYGSPNDVCTYDIMKDTILLLNGDDSILSADMNRFSESPRHLRMNQEKIAAFGIRFSDTKVGIRQCLRDYQVIS